MFLGQLFIANLNDLIATDGNSLFPDFKVVTDRFIQLLSESENVENWIQLVKLQLSELSPLLAKADPSPEIDGTSPTDQSNKGFSTPKASDEDPDFNKMKIFSPLLTEIASIPCTVATCRSKFKHKRSYLKHMRTFHVNVEVGNVRDPAGTCQLISPLTGRPCLAKLPIRSIYYHLKQLHNEDRPSPVHVLWGWDLTSVPKPVFVTKARLFELQKSRQLQDSTTESSQSVAQSKIGQAIEADNEFEIQNQGENTDSSKSGQKENSSISSHMQRNEENSTVQSRNHKSQISISNNVESSKIPGPVHCSNAPVSTSCGDGRSEKSSNLVGQNHPNSSQSKGEKSKISAVVQKKNSPITSTCEGENSRLAGNFLKKTPDKTRKPVKRKLLPSPAPSLGSSFNLEYLDVSNESFSLLDNIENYDLDNLFGEESTSIIDEEVQNNSGQDDTLLEANTEPLDQQSNKSPLLDASTDTDHEDGDDENYTKKRRKNKELRYKSRISVDSPLHERQENVKFIQDFVAFMTSSNIASTNPNNVTVSKAIRHLFNQHDSLLAFEKERNINFSLESLRNFDPNKLVHLKYPLDWIVSTAGRDGNKGTDRLKCHATLRSFLEYEVDKFSVSEDFAPTKRNVKENLSAITSQVSNNKLYKKYKILSNQARNKTNKAKMILEPSKTINIDNVVKSWNESLEKEEYDRDMQFIFESAQAENSISKRNFTKYSSYARIMLLLSDKNRQGSYQFSFKDYQDKMPIFFPPNYKGFNELPDDYNIWIPPESGAEPTMFVINLTGKFKFLFQSR